MSDQEQIKELTRLLEAEREARILAEEELGKKHKELTYVAENMSLKTKEWSIGVEEAARFPEENRNPVLRVDDHLRVIYVNSAGKRYFGNNGIAGKQFTQLRQKIQSSFKDKENKEVELWFGHDCFKCSIVAISNRNYINLYLSDITVEKHVLSELRNSEKRTEALLNATPDMIFRINIDGIFLDFKRGISPTLQPSLEDDKILGNSIYDTAIDPDTVSVIMQGVFEAIKKNKLIQKEYVVTMQDGSRYSFDARIVKTSDKEAICTIRDITLEKDSREKLARSEAMYRNLIENMQLALMEVDNDEKIVKVYDTFVNLMGYSEDELIGLDAKELLVNEEDKEFHMEQTNDRKNGISSVYESRVKTKAGEEKWILISGTPKYDDHGEVIGSIGIHLDITHRVKTEYELKNAIIRAEISSKAKERFLANMSHEIRTPLNVIMGMTKLLSDLELSTQSIEYLNAIKDSSNHLLVVINDILDFSKIDSGEMDLSMECCDLGSILSEIVLPFKYKAEDKNIQLLFHFDRRIDKMILTDEVRLKQVIINLIGNAIKFTSYGKVELAVRLLREQNGAYEIEFVVSDTGIGIPKKMHDLIFDDFRQADSSTSKEYGGTGLGLSISQKIVELLGGRIHVSSIVGKGSSFSFQLAFEVGKTIADKTLSEKPDTHLVQIDRVRILVAEDNEFNQLLAKTLLEKSGAVVYQAFNGEKAIDFIEKGGNDVDLILMDIQMPLVNGVEAMKEIKKMRPQLPIIALTANAIKGDREKFIAQGFDAYLSKPFEESDLIKVVHRYMNTETVSLETSKLIETVPDGISDKVESTDSQEDMQQMYTLEKLQKFAGGDETLIGKLLHSFVDHTPETIELIAECLESSQYKPLASHLHKLKSSFIQIAREDFSERLKQLEKEAGGGSFSEDYLRRLEVFVKEVRLMLHQLEELVASDFSK